MPANSSLPLSAHELQEAMRNARPIDAARLDRVLRVEAGHGVVEVQANTTWRSLAAHLRPGNAQAAALRTTMPTVAASLARNGPLALIATKQILQEQFDWSSEEMWEQQGAISGPVFASEDAKEGIGAFLGKRTPKWSGK